MLTIPNTTLCCIDCYNHELSIRALRHCLNICNFEKVIFLTDKILNLEDIDVITIPTIKTKEQYSIFIIKELNKYIDTEFALLIQYDGYIVNPESWTQEFQDYDYIGAKWFWYKDGFNVGNGGFSLRSKKLLKALNEDDVWLSIESLRYGEDTFICRIYRRFLENKYGIKFASESIADKFSHERSEPNGKTFGFHGLFNIWRYIKDDELENFINLLHPRTLSAIETIELAMNYHAKGKVTQAEIICKKILQHYPNHSHALSLLKTLGSK